MEQYIRRRRARIVEWVALRPIYAACKGGGEPKRGTPRHLWWWEQEFVLDDEGGNSPPSNERVPIPQWLPCRRWRCGESG